MVTECSDCRVHSLHSAVSAGWWQPARVGGSVVGCDREASAGVKRKGWDVLAAIGGGVKIVAVQVCLMLNMMLLP